MQVTSSEFHYLLKAAIISNAEMKHRNEIPIARNVWIIIVRKIGNKIAEQEEKVAFQTKM